VRVVVDTNVLVGALHKNGGPARRVILACLRKHYRPVVGVALFTEYEDVFQRARLWKRSRVGAAERTEVFKAFVATCLWTEVFFLWRPNLRDEADNCIIETAVAGGARVIVTRNVRDLRSGDLRFPDIDILTPEQLLTRFPCPP